MGKFKDGLYREHIAAQKKAELQEHLHDKHKDVPAEVTIVEKSNTLKFLIRSISAAIRVIATIGVLALAVIGLTAIIYPSTRSDLIIIANDLVKQITQFLGV